MFIVRNTDLPRLYPEGLSRWVCDMFGNKCVFQQPEDTDLFKTYTMQSILDKLDVIECFEVPGQKLRVGELLEKQKDIYISLGGEPPSSL